MLYLLYTQVKYNFLSFALLAFPILGFDFWRKIHLARIYTPKTPCYELIKCSLKIGFRSRLITPKHQISSLAFELIFYQFMLLEELFCKF